MKTMCLIIPTKGRPDAINAYLASQAYIAGQLGIDILIQDSSESDETRKIVEKWKKQHLCKIDYFYYVEPLKINSIDEKIQEISQIASKKYAYLCFSSDGTILQMNRVWTYVESYVYQGIDLIIQGTERLDGQNEVYFNEGVTLLQKCIWRMVALNSTIVSSKFMLACLAYSKKKEDDPTDLWIPMVYFRVIAGRSDVRSVYLYMPDVVKVNPFISESFWRVQGLALWQWGERWCVVIDSLPFQYNGVKASALLSHDAHCHIFSPISVIGLRAYNNFSLADIKRYKHYINRVTRTPVWFFILVAILIHPAVAKVLKKKYKRWKGLKV